MKFAKTLALLALLNTSTTVDAKQSAPVKPANAKEAKGPPRKPPTNAGKGPKAPPKNAGKGPKKAPPKNAGKAPVKKPSASAPKKTSDSKIKKTNPFSSAQTTDTQKKKQSKSAPPPGSKGAKNGKGPAKNGKGPAKGKKKKVKKQKKQEQGEVNAQVGTKSEVVKKKSQKQKKKLEKEGQKIKKNKKKGPPGPKQKQMAQQQKKGDKNLPYELNKQIMQGIKKKEEEKPLVEMSPEFSDGFDNGLSIRDSQEQFDQYGCIQPTLTETIGWLTIKKGLKPLREYHDSFFNRSKKGKDGKSTVVNQILFSIESFTEELKNFIGVFSEDYDDGDFCMGLNIGMFGGKALATLGMKLSETRTNTEMLKGNYKAMVWDLYDKDQNVDLYEILTNPQYGGRQPKEGLSVASGTLMAQIDEKTIKNARKEAEKNKQIKKKEQEEKQKVAQEKKKESERKIASMKLQADAEYFREKTQATVKRAGLSSIMSQSHDMKAQMEKEQAQFARRREDQKERKKFNESFKEQTKQTLASHEMIANQIVKNSKQLEKEGKLSMVGNDQLADGDPFKITHQNILDMDVEGKGFIAKLQNEINPNTLSAPAPVGNLGGLADKIKVATNAASAGNPDLAARIAAATAASPLVTPNTQPDLAAKIAAQQQQIAAAATPLVTPGSLADKVKAAAAPSVTPPVVPSSAEPTIDIITGM